MIAVTATGETWGWSVTGGSATGGDYAWRAWTADEYERGVEPTAEAAQDVARDTLARLLDARRRRTLRSV